MAQSQSNETTAPSGAAKVLDKALDAAHTAVDTAYGAAQPAVQWIDQNAQRPRQLVDSTEEYVRANPSKAIAIAFLAGVIVGRVLL